MKIHSRLGLSFLVTVMAAASFQAVTAATLASDNAGNSAYSDGWQTNDNGGSGFGAWTLASGGGSNGFAGFFIGDTGIAGTDSSFGLYSGGDSAAYANATRAFSGGSLSAGQTFSVDLGHTTTINGEVGLNLLNASNDVVFTLKFVGGQSDWKLNDGGADFGSGQNYDDFATLAFSFTYNGGSSYSYSFGTGSGSNYTATNTISNISAVRFYSNNQGASQNLGVNNMSVVPEPGNAVIGALCAIGLAHYRRRPAAAMA